MIKFDQRASKSGAISRKYKVAPSIVYSKNNYVCDQ